MPIKLEATVPVLVSTDVGATAKWYEEVLLIEIRPASVAADNRFEIELNNGRLRLPTEWSRV